MPQLLTGLFFVLIFESQSWAVNIKVQMAMFCHFNIDGVPHHLATYKYLSPAEPFTFLAYLTIPRKTTDNFGKAEGWFGVDGGNVKRFGRHITSYGAQRFKDIKINISKKCTQQGKVRTCQASIANMHPYYSSTIEVFEDALCTDYDRLEEQEKPFYIVNWR